MQSATIKSLVKSECASGSSRAQRLRPCAANSLKVLCCRSYSIPANYLSRLTPPHRSPIPRALGTLRLPCSCAPANYARNCPLLALQLSRFERRSITPYCAGRILARGSCSHREWNCRLAGAAKSPGRSPSAASERLGTSPGVSITTLSGCRRKPRTKRLHSR